MQQAARRRQQWPQEVAQEVPQVELAAELAASQAVADRYLFLSPEKAARLLYHHQERLHGPRLDLKVRRQLLSSSHA